MKVIFYLFIFFSLNSFAELKGKLTFEETEITQGDTVKAHLLIERENVTFILQDEDLTLKKISPSMLILKPEWIKISENNADIIEAQVLVSILNESKVGETLTLELLQDKVFITVPQHLKINPIGKELPKEMLLLDFPLRIPWDPRIVKLVSGFSILILALAFYFGFRLFFKKKLEQKRALERDKNFEIWKKKIASAKKREDFEDLFKNIKIWNSFILDTNTIKGYAQKMEEHQYKEIWSEEDYKEIQTHHERLQKMLSGGPNGI
ncbi:MAG: hypothetical protein ACOYL6_04900 [Bacteriovoracaceae bacterium]